LNGIYQENFVWYIGDKVFEDNMEFAIRRWLYNSVPV
jgi:hypothetical protein